MSTLQSGPTGTRRGEVVWATDIDDLVARYARSLADQADLMAMLYDEPRKGNAPSRTNGPRNKCGTVQAYKQHLYYGEQTCDKCKRANADYVASAEKKRRGRNEADVRRRAECGTNKAYHQHRYYGEQTCDKCKAAHSRAEQAAKRRRRKEDPAAQTVTLNKSG